MPAPHLEGGRVDVHQDDEDEVVVDKVDGRRRRELQQVLHPQQPVRLLRRRQPQVEQRREQQLGELGEQRVETCTYW